MKDTIVNDWSRVLPCYHCPPLMWSNRDAPNTRTGDATTSLTGGSLVCDYCLLKQVELVSSVNLVLDSFIVLTHSLERDVLLLRWHVTCHHRSSGVFLPKFPAYIPVEVREKTLHTGIHSRFLLEKKLQNFGRIINQQSYWYKNTFTFIQCVPWKWHS